MRRIFGEGGKIASHFPNYEFREGQLTMAEAVQQALVQSKNLAVEGGTGVGKSYAYLIPAIQHALNEGQRVIVSTWSISLQEQLVNKDLPKLQEILGEPFRFALAKGRGNYLSKRRLQRYINNMPTLLEKNPEVSRMAEWARHSQCGSRSDWITPFSEELWDEARSDRDNCLSKRCPTFDSCFFHNARRYMHNCEVIVVNHALFFSNLALGNEGFLPNAAAVIFDEAHHIEQVATDHLGFRLSEADLTRLCDKVGGKKGRGGLMRRFGIEVSDIMSELRTLAAAFFRQARAECGSRSVLRVHGPGFMENLLHRPLTELMFVLKHAIEQTEDEEILLDLESQLSRVLGWIQGLDRFLVQHNDKEVLWVERHGKRVELRGCPVDVGEILEEKLFNPEGPICILTSATLSHDAKFDAIAKRIGFEGRYLEVSSPFNFKEQMDLVYDMTLLEPKGETYENELKEVLQHYLEKAREGGIFVLFTSVYSMRKQAEALEDWLVKQGRHVLVQRRDGSTQQILKEFVDDGKAVLFGTDSFWTGVDIQGKALSTIIVVKLPFQVPDHPLQEARSEYLKSQGGNAFMDLFLPEAILKLRQGIGRLIRHQDDEGQVVILDGRVVSKPYGRHFRKAMPHEGRVCKLSESLEDA